MLDYILEDNSGRVVGIAWPGDRFPTPVPGGRTQAELDLTKLTKQSVAALNAAKVSGPATLEAALDAVSRPDPV